MEGSAFKEQEIIQFPDQHTRSLHARVSQDLHKAGYPTPPKAVNPHDQSPLEDIQQKLGDSVHIVGGVLTEGTGGEESTTRVRTTPSKSARRMLLSKLFRKAA
ncbi:hypothetical protein KKE03_02785 [Patescibacteria group bacterium]|nr:hypothetical protein [Patescibacteria group bacterium]